jgi:probable HAF family extracellular repeat protein
MQSRLRSTRALFSLALGAATAAWAAPAPAASTPDSPASVYPEYRVTVMAPANSVARGINNAGVVIGNYALDPHAPAVTASRAFLNRGRGLVDLGTARTPAVDAVAINDKGQVLGHWVNRAGQRRGYLYAAGSWRDIGALPGRITTFTDINNAGYVTAYGVTADALWVPRSFLRAPNGALTNLGWLPTQGTPLTYAYALNNRNRVVGVSGEDSIPDQIFLPFTWSGGAMRDLGALGSAPNAALAVNDCGQATGFAALKEAYRTRVAVLYSHGRTLDIDGRPATMDHYSEGAAINNHGHVVGTSDHLAGFVYRGRRMQSLDALIDPKLGWNITDPQGINDAGQIAATAYRKGVAYAVRLDLIRPQVLRVPDPEAAGEEGDVAPSALEHADAEAHEIARPIGQ